MSEINTHKEYNNAPSTYEDDEITLKELIEKILEFWREIWSKKWWIILAAIPFMAYFGYNAKNTKLLYQANLTYSLNEGGGGGGALGGLLGSFGLGKGGKVNLERIVALSKSRRIIQPVLFQKIILDTLDGKEDYIANHLITLQEFDKLWMKTNPKFENFRFTTDDIEKFDRTALSAFKMLHGQMIGGEGVVNPIFTNTFNEDTGIMTISGNTVDEELSIDITNLIFANLKEYYLKTNTNSSKNTFEFVQAKTDSIYQRMTSKEYQLSKFNDSHRNLSDPNLLTQRKLMETELLKLKTMYAEATKNYEVADFSLEASTPDISIIDSPIPPISPKGASLLISLIKGAFLGGMLALTIIIGRKIVVDAMRN